jgi:outer membrane protein assembly factor BamE (lipoprotein component of BamABCDE complex)
MFRIKLLTFMLLLILIAGCATTGMDSVKKTRQLTPGMHYDEVVKLLGEPKSSEMVNGKWIVTWKLHENWKGFVYYDMEFNQKKRLVSWAENEEEYQKSQAQLEAFASTLSAGAGAGGGGGNPGPNNPEMMKWMAGYYYSYSSAGMGSSSGTERKIMLCPNGTFQIATESGYSGGAGTSAAWGAVGQGGDRGNWAIQGNQQQGTITLASPEGDTKTYQYSACGNGCFYFGSLKVGYAGPPQCQ